MLRRIPLYVLLVFGSIWLHAQQERILSFDAQITIDTTAWITVKETIVVVAQGSEIQRGIFRSLPTVRKHNGRNHVLQYNILSVLQNGVPAKFHTRSSGDYSIYIGEENVLLSPGEYTYEITYVTNNQIGFFEAYDEIYWNVNGNQWNFPVEKISATVYLPQKAGIKEFTCYTGKYGSREKNCEARADGVNTVVFEGNSLAANENLSIVVTFDKGVLAAPPQPSWLERFGMIVIGVLLTLALILYYWFSWMRHGVDPERPTVFPQFDVPANLSPASFGFIRSKITNNSFLPATLVNLAVKGYIKINQNKNSSLFGLVSKTVFEIEKLKSSDNSLPMEERELMLSLFDENTFSPRNVFVIDGEYNSKFESTVQNYKKNISKQHSALLFSGLNLKFLILPLILLVLYFGYALFYNTNWSGDSDSFVVGVVLLFASIFLAFFGRLIAEYYPKFLWVMVGIYVIGLIIIGWILLPDNFSGPYAVIYVLILVNFCLLMIFSYYIKKPSVQKFQLQSLIAGFEMYLRTAEEQLIQFHNPPEMTTNLYEKYLPYAMILGVDQIWGQKFENHLMQTGMQNTYAPVWYTGTHAFNRNFASTLTSSMSQSISSTSTNPSSGKSGMGGGGFSGGGGGGGGGGGW